MPIGTESITNLSAEALRAGLPMLLASRTEGDTSDALSALAGLLQSLSDADLEQARARFAAAGEDGYRVYEAEPVLRALSRRWLAALMPPPLVEGLEGLARVRHRNQLWVCNHLSYADTSLTDWLLDQPSLCGLVDDMLVVAGPKVYAHPFRRLAACTLNTLQTPQSAHIEHNSANLSAREVAELALESLRKAQVWRAMRGPVLLYPEGSRSRTGRLGSFRRAAARYGRHAEVIVPLSLSGSPQVFGADQKLRAAQVTLRIGEPFAPPKGKTAWLEQAWEQVAAGLEPEHEPACGTRPLV